MPTIDDVAKTVSTFMADYKEMPEEDRPKVLFVIDPTWYVIDSNRC